MRSKQYRSVLGDILEAKTMHIMEKFFFIKDKVNSEEVKIVDCPEELMWADVLTKPLQGTEFRKIRA